MSNIEKSNREILVEAIMNYSGDEYETRQSYLGLAKASENGLLKILENVLSYYEDNYEGEEEKIKEMKEIIGTIIFPENK